MTDSNRKDTRVTKIGSALLEKRTDSIVQELFDTELQLSRKVMQQMRSQYHNEKNNWLNLYKNQEKESESLRMKLYDTEQRLDHLHEEYIQEHVKEMERVKESAAEYQDERKEDLKRWDYIEDQIRLYRQIAEDTRKRLNEKELLVVNMREAFAEREKQLREKFEESESELTGKKDELLSKEEEWLKNKARYEENISELKQKTELFQKNLQENMKSQMRVTDRKDGELGKIQQGLQEALVHYTEEKQKNESLSSELNESKKRINTIDELNRTMTFQLEKERKDWEDVLHKEKLAWESHERDLIQREHQLKEKTEEQVNRVMQMLSSLEKQLKNERHNRYELEQQVNAFHAERKLFDERYEHFKQGKEQETARLHVGLSEIRAALNEEKNILAMEKEEKQNVIAKLAKVQEDSVKLIQEVAQERGTWKKTLLDERTRWENRLKELTERMAVIRQSREDEINGLSTEVDTLTGELAELKQIYHAKKIENEQNLGKIQELEISLGKQIDLVEKERNSWEIILASEIEQNRNQEETVINREKRLREALEDALRRTESALSETMEKLIETERQIQSREIELVRKDKTLDESRKREQELVKEITDRDTGWEDRSRNFIQMQSGVVKDYQTEINLLRSKMAEMQKEMFATRRIEEHRISEIKILQDKLIQTEEQGVYQQEIINTREKELKKLRQEVQELKQDMNGSKK